MQRRLKTTTRPKGNLGRVVVFALFADMEYGQKILIVF